ncbi:MAG: tetratricopeptide repeat protein [Deltaproteobacteria bacterium]|nr:tetratricopeptide repeat protein [Deltaproteobacteria bacterium]
MTEIGSDSTQDKNSSITGNLFLKNFVIGIFLTLLIITLYWQITYHDFINLDDVTYVTENALVKQGLTAKGITEAFTSVYASNWHPLTWISHMLDLEFFGMNPGMHHMVNVLFHTLNSILLFLLLQQMTGSTWRSVTVASLFAIHPLHVESVAWIAERKDVLSTFFWMLTIIAYTRYVRQKSAKAYLLTVLCYLLGLLSKPMLVTLPFVLLLLDFWPLKRWGVLREESTHEKISGRDGFSNKYCSGLTRPIIEKMPLFLLAAASCVITIYVQKENMRSLEVIPFMMRISNAINSYVVYLEKTVWPFDLTIFYPFHPIHPLRVVFCATGLCLISLSVLAVMKRFPYLAVGWLWYLGTLTPVIGIVQVGGQSMADRYTYVPLIGIFIMMVWGLAYLIGRRRFGKITLWVIFVVVLALLSARTYQQLGLWKNTEILFKHALKVTQNNYIAHYSMGYILEEKGDINGAIMHYEEVLRINPQSFAAHNNLGAILCRIGRTDEGIQHFLAALKPNPYMADTYYNLGKVYYEKGNTQKAIEYFQKALNEKKNHNEAQENLDKSMKIMHEIKK